MRKITLLIFLLFSIGTTAQYGKNCEIRQWKINIVNPGLEYEKGIGVNQTLNVRAAWQLALDLAMADPYKELDFFPAITVQTRFYYNFEKRARKRRQIYGNSADYFAPTVAILSPDARVVDNEIVDGLYGYGGLVYGIQRSYNSGLSFSIDAGAAYYVGSFKRGIYPVVNLSIGWIVSEKRWCMGK
ncbi:hypothetical protein [Croceitalea rosinachiae]|uniref:DUF3575 domain-containing protein n=1 Tax=Croceitalea rosinachiae TaxID=3075596 RepID=A0ABU3AD01_9FLAO|nr:hypothetical protein [Croceitalea sp. F388]MDT0608064.1 hypothetical protein [Croceitalea sp. F388]